MLNTDLAAETLDEAAMFLTDENVLPCDEGNAIAESISIIAMGLRYDIREMVCFCEEMREYLKLKLDGWRRVDGLPEDHAIVYTASTYLTRCEELLKEVSRQESRW